MKINEINDQINLLKLICALTQKPMTEIERQITEKTISTTIDVLERIKEGEGLII